MTRWHWKTISPELVLTLTLDSDDPELIERVETSAKAQGIALERIHEGWPEPAPLPEDYWETAE